MHFHGIEFGQYHKSTGIDSSLREHADSGLGDVVEARGTNTADDSEGLCVESRGTEDMGVEGIGAGHT